MKTVAGFMVSRAPRGAAVLALAALALGLVFAFAAASVSNQHAGIIGIGNLEPEKLTGPEAVVVKGVEAAGSLPVLVTVDTDGRVIDARVEGKTYLDPSPGLAAARSWTFRPQTFRGQAVRAVGTIEISYEPPEIPPDAAAPFPQAAAPADFEITLARSACFGACPDYRVSISGDGTVAFSTREENFPATAAQVHRAFNGQSVLWPGAHEARVDPAQAAVLLGKFRAAHFFGLKPEYFAGITDNPTYALTVRVGNRTKQVTDYVGRMVGMPKSVTALEDAVDALAGSRSWTRGDARTVALLKQQGFDFSSGMASDLVQYAMELNWARDDVPATAAFVRAMIAAGVDLNRPVDLNGPTQTAPLGAIVAQFAANIGDEALFDQMARAGYVGRMSKAMLAQAFAGGMGCSPAIAQAMVKAGADPRGSSENGNALYAIQSDFDLCSADPRKLAEMTAALIRLGVPLEARSDIDWTPLMGADVPEAARLLIAAGANVNAKSGSGETPLLLANDDRIAIMLLEAGADPHAKDSDGTVRQHARAAHLPATLAWLDAHGIK